MSAHGRESGSLSICVYHSLGPHFLETVEKMRVEHPDSQITVLIPPGYTVTEETQGKIDEIIVRERMHYSPLDLRVCLRLIRQIRAQRFDVFTVMFDSPQLRSLAALSKASTKLAIVPGCRIVPLRRPLALVIAREVLGRMWGHKVYAMLWVLIRVLPVTTHRER